MQAEQDVNMVSDDLPSLSEIDADISTVRRAVAAAEAEEERFATEARRQQGFGSEGPSMSSGPWWHCVGGPLCLAACCCVTGGSMASKQSCRAFRNYGAMVCCSGGRLLACKGSLAAVSGLFLSEVLRTAGVQMQAPHEVLCEPRCCAWSSLQGFLLQLWCTGSASPLFSAVPQDL